MESTIQLFSQLVDNLPPLLPDDLNYRIRKELKNIQTTPSSLGKLEKMMIQIGYEIWPWNQAFREILRQAENRLGEEFLLCHLDPILQQKYQKYQALGMTWSDVHAGRAAGYFTEDERVEVTAALVAMRQAVRDFAAREAVGMQKEKYLKKIEDFKLVLKKIKSGLDGLRTLAAAESDHPMLAKEILARVEAFEHGLCLLAPEFEHEEIDQAHEFFRGRRLDLGRMRGIHETVELDFYS